MGWEQMNTGATMGQPVTENGVIICDEEHNLGSRITLERGCDHAPFAITCGIYGWMFHTRYLSDETTALAEVGRMKEGLVAILALIPHATEPEVDAKIDRVTKAIADFVEQFP